MKRWIMHADMDAFYASVEQRDNIEYRGRPVIVGGLSSRGVVATASYEARACGVHSAMPIAKAKRLCPDGIYLQPRMEYYRRISETIREIMSEFTPYIEPLSLDEAFLEVSGMHKLYAGPKALGEAFKSRVFDETGLIVSTGLAPNKFLAKIASDLEKPDGLVVVSHGGEKAFLRPLPVGRLWGVGKALEAGFKERGFYTIGDVADLPDAEALRAFCGNQAEHFYDLARGIDDRPVEWNRSAQSIGNEETYMSDITDESVIDREWRYFAHKVARRLRKKGVRGDTVAIKVRFDDFSTVSRQKALAEPTDSEGTLYRVAALLYNRIVDRRPIRLLGLTVGGLTKSDDDVPLISLAAEDPKLVSVLDELEERFGENVVMKGALWTRATEDERREEYT